MYSSFITGKRQVKKRETVFTIRETIGGDGEGVYRWSAFDPTFNWRIFRYLFTYHYEKVETEENLLTNGEQSQLD